MSGGQTLLEAMQSGLPKDYPTDGPIDEAMKIPSHATQPALAPTSDEIIPKPFFVLKTKNEKQQKVFINVCGSHKVTVFTLGLTIAFLSSDQVAFNNLVHNCVDYV